MNCIQISRVPVWMHETKRLHTYFHLQPRLTLGEGKETMIELHFSMIYSPQALTCASASATCLSASALLGNTAYFVGSVLNTGPSARGAGKVQQEVQGLLLQACCAATAAHARRQHGLRADLGNTEKTLPLLSLSLSLSLSFSLAANSLSMTLGRGWWTCREKQSRRPCTCY
jgi:hypothetical protein